MTAAELALRKPILFKGIYVLTGLIVAGAVLAWSYQGIHGYMAGLFTQDSAHQIYLYVKNLFPPDFSKPVMMKALKGGWVSLAISVMGTLIAILFAFPAGILASANLMYSGTLFLQESRSPIKRYLLQAGYWGARLFLNVLRSIPDLIWAFIFVFIVGLGPFAGVLALTCHTTGVLGKLFAEAIENVNPQPVESLQSLGASRLQILFYGILPQVKSQFITYALYRWEMNIRDAMVLGFVGAGGLGQNIYVAMELFYQNQLLTYMIALYVLVIGVDTLSLYLRRASW